MKSPCQGWTVPGREGEESDTGGGLSGGLILEEREHRGSDTSGRGVRR